MEKLDDSQLIGGKIVKDKGDNIFYIPPTWQFVCYDPVTLTPICPQVTLLKTIKYVREAVDSIEENNPYAESLRILYLKMLSHNREEVLKKLLQKDILNELILAC